MSRVLILVIGPMLIVGGCTWLTQRQPVLDSILSTVTEPLVDASSESLGLDHEYDRTPKSDSAELKQARLREECEQVGRRLTDSLPANCSVIVSIPYIVAGDLSKSQLQEQISESILPTARALRTCYFDVEPVEPITVLLFSNDRSFRNYAETVDGHVGHGNYGYYRKAERKVVLNIATGTGTLAHELTHALAHVDFPNMPEWFDEGLASVHEECEFSDDGLRLVCASNWRLAHLKQALQDGQLRSLEEMIVAEQLRKEHAAIDYAHVRYFCLFLQERQLLCHFYRKLRSATDDPSGIATLRKLIDQESLADLEREFRQWARAIKKS